jgi:hypothetical protein
MFQSWRFCFQLFINSIAVIDCDSIKVVESRDETRVIHKVALLQQIGIML